MKEGKKKSPDKVTASGSTKLHDVSEEVEVFFQATSCIKDAIDDLVAAIESIRQELVFVHDNEEIAISEGRIARTLMSLLAEQAEKLKCAAKSHKENLENFVRE